MYNIQSMNEINKIEKQYKVVSLFSGCGGSSLGYKMAGLNVLLANEFIPKAIETYKPQVVIIDGVRDLLHDFNDVGESLDTLQLLMDATAASEELALIAVLHMNEGTDKMRGHLGTELWNKCNTRLECSKENGVFTVQNKSRLKEAAPFRFCINDAGDYAPSDAVNAAGVINDADALALCFDGGDKECGVTFDELIKRYKKFAGLSSQNQARQILKEKINGGAIRKDETTRLFYLA